MTVRRQTSRPASRGDQQGGQMAGLGDTDGYEGTAVVEVGRSRFDVQVRLRGHFQPIDGRYHWHGRISAHEGLDGVLGSGKAAGVLTTAQGSAPCELSEPDPSRRYRVTGISTPPFRTADAAELGAGAEEDAPYRDAGAVRDAELDRDARPEPVAEAPAPLPGHVRVAILRARLGGIGVGTPLPGAGVSQFVIPGTAHPGRRPRPLQHHPPRAPRTPPPPS